MDKIFAFAPSVKTYTHNEAFCLMYYENEQTKKGFLVWNSRDGVSPFIVYENGLEYIHQHWDMDKRITNENYIKERILVPGQRVFRSATVEEEKKWAMERMRKCKGTEYEVEEGSERWNMVLEEAARQASLGGPTMVTVKEKGIVP